MSLSAAVNVCRQFFLRSISTSGTEFETGPNLPRFTSDRKHEWPRGEEGRHQVSEHLTSFVYF